MKTTIREISPASADGRLIAVSDIHGYVRYLRGLLDKLRFSKQDTLLIIGDMIEKGPESLATVRFILDRIAEGYPVFVSMGNVEMSRLADLIGTDPDSDERFLHTLQYDRNVWKHGLFLDMLDELGISPDVAPSGVPALKQTLLSRCRREIDWLLNLPTVLTAGNFIFAHAGVPTDDLVRLRETDAWECLKRDAFLLENVRFTRYIVTGHWPVTLYRSDIDTMGPIYDAEKRIVAIDGGCALKAGAQLNALILPADAQDMDRATFAHYDDFPVITAAYPQKGRAATIHMRYFDCSVDVLEEMDDLVRLRHHSTGRIFLAPKYLLYRRPGKPVQCDDYSDALLEVNTGDRLSVVKETSIGMIVKKDGELGWYLNKGGNFSL